MRLMSIADGTYDGMFSRRWELEKNLDYLLFYQDTTFLFASFFYNLRSTYFLLRYSDA